MSEPQLEAADLSGIRPGRRSDRRALVAVLVLLAAIAATDAVLRGPTVLVGSLAVGPCLAAGFARRWTVVGVGACALALAVSLSGPDDLWAGGRLAWDLLALLLVTAASVALAGRRLTQQQLATSAGQRFARVFESVPTGLALVRGLRAGDGGPAGRGDLVAANEAFRGICRWPDGPPNAAVLDLLAAAATASAVAVETEIAVSPATTAFVRLSAVGVPGDPGLQLVHVHDITIQREAERQLTRQALHDALTGLPSRLLLTDRTQLALARSGRSGEAVGLLYLDLDRFKNVNDSLGHEAGDEVLVEVGKRLSAVVRPQDTVSRLGGDEFVVVLDGIALAHADHELAGAADRIQQALRAPVRAVGRDVFVTVSIGMTACRDTGATLSTLLRDADTAMYRAKEHGRARYELFDDGLRRRAVRRLAVESDLHHALARNELRLHYQPVVEVSTGRITGAEALIRWQHPAYGMLPPSAFILVAEDSGLINSIGDWVIGEAVDAAVAWRDDRPDSDFVVSVNVSSRQLFDPGFADRVVRQLSRSELPADHLVLELTESVYAEAIAATVNALHRLSATGVRLALDDFGTGYSSLTYLRQYPFDRLKVDRSFVTTMSTDSANDKIVKGVLSLAAALGLTAVAEGVETAAVAMKLAAYGCPLAQGDIWSPPLELSRLLELPRNLTAADVA